MQLIRAIAVCALCITSFSAHAQQITPLRKTGTTLTQEKGFLLIVRNPYTVPMTFVLEPMEPDFKQPAQHAKISPKKMTLAPDFARKVLFRFTIPEGEKERKIALCVRPSKPIGVVMPRVCGTYIGKRLVRKGG